jgi:hypothetical protein
MIKVLKHLRSHWRNDAVSFHLECLLYSLSPVIFIGGPADYITNVLTAIASTPADTWYREPLMTPCGDRDIFTPEEWTYVNLARVLRRRAEVADRCRVRHDGAEQGRRD